MLRRFGSVEKLDPVDPLYAYMRMVGEDLLEHLRVARERLDFVAERVEWWTVPCGDDRVEAVFLPRTDPAAEEPSNMLESYVRAAGLGDVVAAVVYPDRRGPGFGIARYEDHAMLDFSRVEAEPDVHFAHKSGFMCKTSATDPTRLKALVAGAFKG